MKRIIWELCKVILVFACCTALFYLGLRIMHAEYEQFHRYDEPIGPAVKVFNEEESLIERLHLFFRLGE